MLQKITEKMTCPVVVTVTVITMMLDILVARIVGDSTISCAGCFALEITVEFIAVTLLLLHILNQPWFQSGSKHK